MKLSGLILDNNRSFIPNGSWAFAKNIVISKDGQSIFNENGFRTNTSLVDTVIGSISIGLTNIIFVTDGVISRICTVVDNVFTTIVSSTLFNFNLQYPVYGVATYNHKSEIIICFIDDYNSIKLLNINDLPFPSRVDNITKELNNPSEFTLCELFPSVKNPTINNLIVNDSGGNLSSGVYYATIRYVFDDNSATIFQEVSNPIIVTDDSMLINATNIGQYDGCVAGTLTNKSITFDFINLDTNFTTLRVGIISKINGVVSAYESENIPYSLSSKTVVISSVDSLNTSSLSEILEATSIYSKARAISLVNDRPHLANLTGIPAIDYQAYANAINVEWYRDDYVSLDDVRSSYKDSTVLFTKKQFKSGEVYDLHIGLRLLKGGYYGVWHIPGRIAQGDDKLDLIASYPYNILASNPLKYQFEDTSGNESNDGSYGSMSFWENVNEVYPVGFADFAGENVRHHKFPTLGKLEYNKALVNKKGFITPFVPNGGASLQVVGSGSNGTDRITFPDITGTAYGVWSNDNTEYTANQNQLVNGSVALLVYNEVAVSSSIYVRTSKNTIRQLYSGSSILTVDITNVFLATGDTLVMSCVGTFDVDSDSMFMLTFAQSDELLYGTKFTQPLGLRISNVVIPDELKEYVDGWEIFYAERTVDNMSIVGQDIMFGDSWKDNNYNYTTIRTHAFDLMTNRLAVNPTYINRHLDFTVTEDNNTADFNAICDYVNYNYQNTFSLSVSSRLIYVINKGYLPALIDSPLYDNSKREDALILDTDTLVNNTPGHRFLADICVYKNNMYVNYQNQRLVSTGIFVNVVAGATQPSVVIYGGDTVISRYAYRLDYQDVTSKYLLPYIVAETISNGNLRHEGTAEGEVYYPKSTAETVLSDAAIILGNWWQYNNDYNIVNNISQPVIDYPNINLVNRFPFRIARALPKQSESTELTWRTFLISDYYEMTTAKGVIVKLTAATDKVLYIAHEYALFVAKVKDTIDATTGVLTLKEGDLFDREPQEVIPDNLGYIGTQNRFATFMCKYGYFTIDNEKGKVYLINDNIVDIAEDDVSEFLKSHLPTTTDDNPFTEIGLSAGYDDENDRIIITFNNRTAVQAGSNSSVSDNTYSIANKSFTISVNLRHKFWVAFHDYLINHYIVTRNGIIGVINHGGSPANVLTSSLYHFNDSTKFAKYPSDIVNSLVDFIFDNQSTPEILIENISYDVELKSGTVSYWNKTLSKLMIYSKQQCSGEIPLLIQTWANQNSGGNVKNVKGLWVINKFKDRAMSGNIAFLNTEGAVLLEALEGEYVTSIIVGRKYIVSDIGTTSDYITYNGIDYTENGQYITPIVSLTAFTIHGTAKVKNFKYWYEMSNIITNFAVVRLKYDNSEQLKMKVNNIVLNVK